MKKVAAIVKGEKIYESEVEACKEQLKRIYQRQRKAPFGEKEEARLKEQAQQLLIQMKIAQIKAKELKLDQFTREEKEKFQEIAKKNWNESLQSYRTMLQKKNPSMTNEDAEKKAREYMAQKGYANSDPLCYAMMNQEIFNRIQAYVAKGITVSDEETRQTYEQLVERDKKAFSGNIAQYESVLARYGNVVYYIPEGYRLVKHIRLVGDEKKQNELKELMYESNGAKKAEIDEEKAEKLRSEILKKVQEQTAEIEKEYAQGTAFEALIEKYSADKKTGWNIHADSIFWEKPAVEAVMKMEKIGSLSEPAACSTGVFVFRYEADTEAGALPFTENVLKNLKAAIYRRKVNEQMASALKQWSEE